MFIQWLAGAQISRLADEVHQRLMPVPLKVPPGHQESKVIGGQRHAPHNVQVVSTALKGLGALCWPARNTEGTIPDDAAMQTLQGAEIVPPHMLQGAGNGWESDGEDQSHRCTMKRRKVRSR